MGINEYVHFHVSGLNFYSDTNLTIITKCHLNKTLSNTKKISF